MPSYSVEYLLLKDRLNLLSRKFIEDQVDQELADPLEFNPDIEKIAAFRVLVHAEVEEYIERKARKWLQEKEALVKSGEFILRTIWELFPISILLNIPMDFNIPFDKSKFIEKCQKIIEKSKKFIDDNNGIKLDSFMKLSILCGKMIDEIDYATAIQLNEYGKDRGDVAHKSVSRVSTIQAPSVEQKKAKDIVESLGKYFYSDSVAGQTYVLTHH